MSRRERLRREMDAQRAIRDAALAQAAAAREQIARIRAEMGEREELRIPEPVFPIGKPAIVYFQKEYGGRVYDYAAIKAGGLWYLTQDGENPLARRGPMTWEELLEFAGEEAPIFPLYPMSSGGYV